MHRGLQYKRAIQLYYKNSAPIRRTSSSWRTPIEIRFLRKRYNDPITGKDDWRLIHMGEAKVPPMGFFGQPLQAGMSSASTGPGAGHRLGEERPAFTPIRMPRVTNGSANGAPGTGNGGSTTGGSSRIRLLEQRLEQHEQRPAQERHGSSARLRIQQRSQQLPVPAAWAPHRTAPTAPAQAARAAARPSAAPDRLWVSASR